MTRIFLLGNDQPFFKVLFKNRSLFRLGFYRFLERRIPGKNGEVSPREMAETCLKSALASLQRAGITLLHINVGTRKPSSPLGGALFGFQEDGSPPLLFHVRKVGPESHPRNLLL